jgi:hypothetical protein
MYYVLAYNCYNAPALFFLFFNGWKDGIFYSFTTGTENFFLIDYFVLGS